jgi:hypothetical protein
VLQTTLASASLAVLLAAGLAVPALQAEPKGPKHSERHDAAVQRCTDEYEARVAWAHAPHSPTGKARMRTMHAAAEAKKACVARAPR